MANRTLKHFLTLPPEQPKWFILDGKLDANWIESFNTLMDDNRKLCLSNGEIIPLAANSNLIFEIDNLSHATPATVSRAALVRIIPCNEQWKSYVAGWAEGKPL